MQLLTRLDRFLNGITMYRLLFYGLGILLALGSVCAALGMFSFGLGSLLVSVAVLLASSVGSNLLFAKLYRVPVNVESAYITALILALIITPKVTVEGILGLVLAGVLAMASKYVLALHHKHIFNPVALSAFLVSLFGFARVGWWVGTATLLPFTLILGYCVLRKIRREKMAGLFLLVALVIILFEGLVLNGQSLSDTLSQTLLSGPIIFFAGVMLTEPLTTPPTVSGRYYYAALIALAMTSRWRIGDVSAGPLTGLLLGNIFSYIISPKQRLTLTLKEVQKMAPNIWNFVFTAPEKLKFTAGQYAEWTLATKGNDDRGNRRYFTIASPPGGDEVHLGVKFYQPSSSFKEQLMALQPGDPIVIGQVAGDFTLSNPEEPVLFLAGGVGVTPFRSMIETLPSTANAVLLYGAANPGEVVYRETIAKIPTSYVLGNAEGAPAEWNTRQGYMTTEILQDLVPDIATRKVYISGPNMFVDKAKEAVKQLGAKKVVTDYFPGY